MTINRGRMAALWAGLGLAALAARGLCASEVPILDEQSAPAAESGSAAATGDDLSNWYDRLSLGGYVNAGYAQTGANGAFPQGHFYASEREFGTMLFLDAQITDDVLVHNEFYLYNQALGLSQLYIEIPDLLGGDGLLSMRIGRLYIPFGEEYLWQGADQNPMVLRTVAWPWGYSQGLLLYGRLGLFHWIVSGMDGLGSQTLSSDDGTGKSYTTRLTLEPAGWLHLSASGIENGRHSRSALTFNGNPITPLGQTALASGPSPSQLVDFEAAEGDLVLTLGPRLRLRGDWGIASVMDNAPWDRTFSYYYGEALYDFTPKVYLAARYSAVGTFDPNKGYIFGGDYDNADDFNFDVESLTRVGACVGIKLMKRLTLKIEGDNDTVQLINAAVQAGERPGAGRWTGIGEFVATF